MKKRVFIFLLVVAITFSSYWIGYSSGKEKEDFYKELDVFSEALSAVDKKYVEEKTSEELIHGAIRGLLGSLDSYSQFMTSEEYKELMVETEGKFGGIGIEITLKNNLLTVVSPLEDTPAWKSGVKAGDIIVKIDGELSKGITLQKAVKKLRGNPGTKVVITILREENRKLEDITITREIITIKDIKRAVILENGIGYVRITEFRETTPQDLDKALAGLKANDLKGLIIDIRNNPGGLLDSAIEVSSRFLPDGKIIVSTKSRNKQENVYKAVPVKEKYLDMPIVVLINRGSASASEILAAALRENDRAVLLGETSFGKGSVQTILPLSDSSALRLTTAKYYTPKQNTVHEKGINPDIVVAEEPAAKDKDDNKEEEVFNQVEGGVVDFNYKGDNQIIRAIDVLKGLLVFSSKAELQTK